MDNQDTTQTTVLLMTRDELTEFINFIPESELDSLMLVVECGENGKRTE